LKAIHVITTTTDLTTALDLKAPLASPAFTGTVTGVDKLWLVVCG
jgi:hypothetical protein